MYNTTLDLILEKKLIVILLRCGRGKAAPVAGCPV